MPTQDNMTPEERRAALLRRRRDLTAQATGHGADPGPQIPSGPAPAPVAPTPGERPVPAVPTPLLMSEEEYTQFQASQAPTRQEQLEQRRMQLLRERRDTLQEEQRQTDEGQAMDRIRQDGIRELGAITDELLGLTEPQRRAVAAWDRRERHERQRRAGRTGGGHDTQFPEEFQEASRRRRAMTVAADNNYEMPNDMSRFESFFQGAGDWALAGWGDELTGLAGEGMSHLGNVRRSAMNLTRPEDEQVPMEEPREVGRQYAEAARHRSRRGWAEDPVSYGTGAATGTVLATVGTGGLAAEANVAARGAPVVGKAVEAAGRGLDIANRSRAGRLITTAAGGAAVGEVAGLGASEGSLEERYADVGITPALMGALLTPAIGYGGRVVVDRMIAPIMRQFPGMARREAEQLAQRIARDAGADEEFLAAYNQTMANQGDMVFDVLDDANGRHVVTNWLRTLRTMGDDGVVDEAITARAAGRPDRLAGAVDDAANPPAPLTASAALGAGAREGGEEIVEAGTAVAARESAEEVAEEAPTSLRRQYENSQAAQRTATSEAYEIFRQAEVDPQALRENIVPMLTTRNGSRAMRSAEDDLQDMAEAWADNGQVDAAAGARQAAAALRSYREVFEGVAEGATPEQRAALLAEGIASGELPSLSGTGLDMVVRAWGNSAQRMPPPVRRAARETAQKLARLVDRATGGTYLPARGNARSGFQAQEMFDMGRRIMRRSQTAEEISDAVANLGEEGAERTFQMGALARGMWSEILDSVEGNPTAALRRLERDQSLRGRMVAALGGDEMALEPFTQAITREMNRLTRDNRIRGGSQTAEKLLAVSNAPFTGLADDLVVGFRRGGLGGLALPVMQRVGDLFSNFTRRGVSSPAVRRELAEILTREATDAEVHALGHAVQNGPEQFARKLRHMMGLGGTNTASQAIGRDHVERRQ